MGTRDGEGGIRTLGTCYQVQRLSRAPDSATLAPLQVPAGLGVPTPCGPEREGFEPPGPRSGPTVFKTASFDHSVISPSEITGPPRGPTRRNRLAERVGFEPTEPLRAQRFSRPSDSTALASLRGPGWPEIVGAQGCASRRSRRHGRPGVVRPPCWRADDLNVPKRIRTSDL